MKEKSEIRKLLLAGLTDNQETAVQSDSRRVLVVAGAGSGKTEVMARRIAWWVGINGIPKDNIVAFTFTEKAAEEMKFRVRKWMAEITADGEEANLAGMYVGTIHGYCLAKLREYWPDVYHNFDILDEAARSALILREYHGILGLKKLQSELNVGQFTALEQFTRGYDQMHEHNRFDVSILDTNPPYELGQKERDWCAGASLHTNVGNSNECVAFAESSARYYAYLRCRRFLDFATSQTEFLRNLTADPGKHPLSSKIHLVVDEVQDINPVQRDLINALVAEDGHLTAVGDHRQAIYGFRGAKVEIIGEMWNEFTNADDSSVVDLQENFRSTPRIIEIANSWAKKIGLVHGMRTPPMKHGKPDRKDAHASHVAQVDFANRNDEATWIGEAIRALVPTEKEGAAHDRRDGKIRGLALSDVAVLVRSSTDVRTYMQALEAAGIPSIVRAGPDLYSQPEVLLFLGALAIAGGIGEFYATPQNPQKGLPGRIKSELGCDPDPEGVVQAAGLKLRNAGLPAEQQMIDRIGVRRQSDTRSYRVRHELFEDCGIEFAFGGTQGIRLQKGGIAQSVSSGNIPLAPRRSGG